MKSVLINKDNIIVDIVEPGEEFEVHESLTWKECSTTELNNESVWQLNADGTATDIDLEAARTAEGRRKRFEKARTVAYGEIGEQLDMLYKDMKNGTSNWVDKIDQIKTDIPKVEKPADAQVPSDYIPPVDI